MPFLFIQLGFFDIIDILLVSFILFLIYKSLRGTVAMNIFVGLFMFYLLWLIVQAFEMKLVSTILGQFIGIGVVALLIVFQQEVRRFLLLIGTRNRVNHFLKLFNNYEEKDFSDEIVAACEYFVANKVGALIIIQQKDDLLQYADTGIVINADIKSELLKNIFFKNSPLHDGALIIRKSKILAASCILPISYRKNIPASLGLRHRAAIGLCDLSDAHIVVVSEETGNITFLKNGSFKIRVSLAELKKFLTKDFSGFVAEK